uniref:Uncharacterized protein n=1 Tax=Aegilops tauschii subsp. strangulata TaxID=200361 RepID=A0A453MCD1_AEGTS
LSPYKSPVSPYPSPDLDADRRYRYSSSSRTRLIIFFYHLLASTTKRPGAEQSQPAGKNLPAPMSVRVASPATAGEKAMAPTAWPYLEYMAQWERQVERRQLFLRSYHFSRDAEVS